MNLANKVVLITGASAGIGAATAIAFDRAGARVAITARRKEKLDQVALSLHDPLVLKADLSDTGEAGQLVSQTVARFGRIDILINNAASIIVSPADTVSPEDMLSAFRANLVAPLVAIQEAARFMKQNGGGQVINVGSPGFMMGIPFYSPYVCSKAALSALTRTMQAEWAGSNIRVSEYFPGYIRTDSLPESRIGEVGQDLLMSPNQNLLTRIFARPKTAEYVAAQLVRLAETPKTLVCTTFSVKLGTFISNVSSFRLSIARQMAETARKKIIKN